MNYYNPDVCFKNIGQLDKIGAMQENPLKCKICGGPILLQFG
jgi:hypothetical protein